jgi:hypothetical protein
MSFDDLFRRDRPRKMLQITPSRAVTAGPIQALFWLEWSSSTACGGCTF